MEKKTSQKRMQRDFEKTLKALKGKDDFLHYELTLGDSTVTLGYMKTTVSQEKLQKLILPYMKQADYTNLEELGRVIPVMNSELMEDGKKLDERLIEGYVFIYMENVSPRYLLVPIPLEKTRQVSIPETEFSVVGPKEAFVENIDVNINLVRKRINLPDLAIEKMKVGSITKTEIAVMYIDGIADKENARTVIQRLEDLQIDQVIDSSYIQHTIADNRNSPFPQLIDTERPDRIAAVLAEGKVVIFVDGSPTVLIGPTTLIEFFSAFEDYFLNWTIASVFRLIRVFAVFFSILITPLYVAVLTHHFELVPKALIGTLVSSRTQVPFPPILEAIILELTIELLREAGARLPTKVGQTIGIVGGIVIGTASVEAGLTSNVLLILVALAALGSFTTPIYQMGNTIRLIRFPLLVIAHIYGIFGIAIAIAYIMVHLIKLTSLGRPFLEPLYPFRFKDFKDTFIRLPFAKQQKRPYAVRPARIYRKMGKDKK